MVAVAPGVAARAACIVADGWIEAGDFWMASVVAVLA